MLHRGLNNPLAAVDVIHRLLVRVNRHGLTVKTSSDFNAFLEARQQLRGDHVSPMFDPTVGELSSKGFWISMSDADGKIECIQACRLDFVDTSLAEWVVGWMAGLYLKQEHLMVPEFLEPPLESRSRHVRGWLVYHGEMWMARKYRGVGNLFDNMGSLAVLLAYIKWQPDAVWGLVSTELAMRGQGNRMSYPLVERSFLRWSLAAPGIPENEWLVLSERQDLEFLANERSVTGVVLKGD